MKSNQILKFIKSLGRELDEEIVKGIKKAGILKIILCIAVFFLLKYLVSYFGSEDDLFKFYFISVIALLLFLVWYASELKEVSKIRFLIDYGGQILMMLISIVIILGLLYGIIMVVIDAFNWVLELFN